VMHYYENNIFLEIISAIFTLHGPNRLRNTAEIIIVPSISPVKSKLFLFYCL
jgi:hypothetical protein